MERLPQVNDPNLLVGYQTSDDAGIYRLSNELALVTTADFITPPVNDPYVYGQIAAANALSDVYAMGGRPLTCLNLVCFPSDKLPQEDLQQIIAGAVDKITEAGAFERGSAEEGIGDQGAAQDRGPRFAGAGFKEGRFFSSGRGPEPEDGAD